MGHVDVEEISRGKALVRFTELPQALHGDDPRFAPSVLAWERFRLARRNPYFERGDAGLFLARRGGRPAGRIAAHVPEPGAPGRFGFWSCVDDPEVAAPLVAAARGWLLEQGCSSMEGPWSFDPTDEPGLLVAGHDVGGLTGRPWSPAWESELLVEALAGAEVVGETRTWRRATTEAASVLPTGGSRPGQAGSYVDDRLVLAGIAAVPDLSAALRTSGLRSTWGLAKRAREGRWDGCTVVRCDADPRIAVPSLLGAAGRAGYSWAVVPWSPDAAEPPETVHRTYRVDL